MSDDSLNRVVIQTIQQMTTEVHQVRADVNRAINPIYQRIVAIERHQKDDGTAREARQQETDQQFIHLKGIVEALDARGKVRLWIDVALLIGVAVVIGLLLAG